jgi:hypothetical protein
MILSGNLQRKERKRKAVTIIGGAPWKREEAIASPEGN